MPDTEENQTRYPQPDTQADGLGFPLARAGQSISDLLCKPPYGAAPIFNLEVDMSTLLVSSKGQIVLPAEMRRRLGTGAGARIELRRKDNALAEPAALLVLSKKVEAIFSRGEAE